MVENIVDVFEQKLSLEKKGRASIAGERVLLTIDDRHFFFNLPKVDELGEKIKTKKEYVVRDGCFTNGITEKVKESYCVRFDEQTIKEISIFINEYPQSILSKGSFKDKIKPILQKHGYTNLHDAVPAFVKYFVIDGMLKRNGSVFEIVRSNLIPKSNTEVNRGFLDELNMS
jgi:hypothetical protein